MKSDINQQDTKTVSVDYVAILLQYATQQGIESDAILAGSDVDTATLECRDSYISSQQYQRIIENTINELDDPSMALKVGQRQQLPTHGALGYAVMSSSTLEEALQLVRRFVRTRNRLTRFNFFFEDNHAVTQVEIKYPIGTLYQHVIELAFSCMLTICNTMQDQKQIPCQIKACYPEPKHSDAYQSLFDTTPEFSADVNEIRIPLECIDAVNIMGNPAFAKIAEQQCEEVLRALESQDDLQGQIHALLTRTPGHIPGQEDIAKQLKLSTRSLSRQLAEQNTTFQKILTQARREMAEEYLRNSDRNIEEIAYLLDYESPSNFTRAFKRWTGVSPQQYRLDKYRLDK